MKWKKHGRIFDSPIHLDWVNSHASVPVIEFIEGDLFKVYFCSRDHKGRSNIGYFVFDINNPKSVLEISPSPILDLGSLGLFDDSGIMVSCIVNVNERKFLYYTGWSLGVSVPFYFSIGLAISDDGGRSFHKFSRSPIMDRNEYDPYLLMASPFVRFDDGKWQMWYVSGSDWKMDIQDPKHYYHIKYAESRDGVNWDRAGIVCIDFKSKEEFAIARPFVIKEKNIYKMWYSYRGEFYRIGYAESKDGIQWQRQDESVGIDISENGWDSEMMAYGFLISHKGTRYMLYNGNDYGKEGIGLASLVDNS